MAPSLSSDRRAIERALTQLGHVATTRQLLVAGRREALVSLVADGSVVRVARGRYASPLVSEGRRAAHRLAGVAAYRTAALAHRWPILHLPRHPEVVVPRGRRVGSEAQAAYDVSWRTLLGHDIQAGWVTTPLRTVLDCAATLPFAEALAVTDSALRCGDVTGSDLAAAADDLPHRGGRRARRVLDHADGRSANPFESLVRSLCLEVDGLEVEPQVRIPDEPGAFLARVDLADRRLRVVVEAESFEFHASEPWMLERDCARYDELAVEGWLVLRVTYAQATRRRPWVLATLRAAVAVRSGRLADL